MNDIEFLDELPKASPISNFGTRRQSPPDPVYEAFAEALREHPKQWAKWPKPMKRQQLYAIGYGIRRDGPASPASFRGGGFEAKVRGGTLYVRYVGGDVS